MNWIGPDIDGTNYLGRRVAWPPTHPVEGTIRAVHRTSAGIHRYLIAWDDSTLSWWVR